MSSPMARALVFCIPAILGWLPLSAQSPNYHLKFEDSGPGRQDVFLVNDSEKPIEALDISDRCWRADGRFGNGSHVSRDILDSWGVEIRPGDESVAHGSGVLETGGQWRTGIGVFTANGDCKVEITAVLFSDGSFAGEDAAVRGLKARRDGLAAAANYWANRIRQEKPDGWTPRALFEELKRHVADDQINQNKCGADIREGTVPLLWQYWSGWLQVERNLEFQFSEDFTKEKADQDFQIVADMVTRWKEKIEDNLALQKLNVIFPAISGANL